MKSAYTLLYFIEWYEKSGNQYMIGDYEIKNIQLETLQKIFDIDVNDPDPIYTDMAYSYDINEIHAKKLEKYVTIKFDFEKYDYMLSGRGDY